MCRKKYPYSMFAKMMADRLDVTKSVPIGLQIDGDENVGISQGVSLFVCQLKGGKKVGIFLGVSPFVCRVKGCKK